jgi:hypothetical protein
MNFKEEYDRDFDTFLVKIGERAKAGTLNIPELEKFIKEHVRGDNIIETINHAQYNNESRLLYDEAIGLAAKHKLVLIMSYCKGEEKSLSIPKLKAIFDKSEEFYDNTVDSIYKGEFNVDKVKFLKGLPPINQKWDWMQIYQSYLTSPMFGDISLLETK